MVSTRILLPSNGIFGIIREIAEFVLEMLNLVRKLKLNIKSQLIYLKSSTLGGFSVEIEREKK